MAALTADKVTRHSMGDTTLIRVEIGTANTITDGDTYASGLSASYLDHWFGAKNNPSTQASAGVHVAHSSGTFTFYPGENAATGTLFVMVQG